MEIWNFSSSVQFDIALNTRRKNPYLQAAIKCCCIYYNYKHQKLTLLGNTSETIYLTLQRRLTRGKQIIYRFTESFNLIFHCSFLLRWPASLILFVFLPWGCFVLFSFSIPTSVVLSQWVTSVLVSATTNFSSSSMKSETNLSLVSRLFFWVYVWSHH